MLNIKVMIVIPINVVDAFLSEDGRIAVASLTTFIITSIVPFCLQFLDISVVSITKSETKPQKYHQGNQLQDLCMKMYFQKITSNH